MKIYTTILFLTLSSLTWAQKAHITILDPNIESKDLEKNFHVHRGSTHKSSIPDKQKRDSALSGVSEVKQWDEVKKDIFYMDLKSKKVPALKKKYPEFSNAKLKTLKSQASK